MVLAAGNMTLRGSRGGDLLCSSTRDNITVYLSVTNVATHTLLVADIEKQRWLNDM
jgi:hypothetical protein